MFYSLLLFIFALIMHILFTLCKIGDGGGRWNQSTENQARWTFKTEGDAYQKRES